MRLRLLKGMLASKRLRMNIQTTLGARLIERLTRRHRGNLLDIGCGDGDFLRTMIRRGWNGTGVELAADKRALLKERGVAVIAPEEWPHLADGSFDAVALWHSL